MILEITRKRLFLFGSFIVVMLAIPITVYLSQQQQDQRSQASEVPDSTVVAIFDSGEQITKGQVRKVAEEQSAPSSVDAEALRVALSNLIEMKILDRAATDLEIDIDQDWVDELIEGGLSENDAYYEVLRNQVTLKAVKSRSAFTVQFWNTPASGVSSLTEEEKTLSARQLADGTPALNRAQALLGRGDDILEVGDTILTEYPSLKPVLAINGYILNGLPESERITAKRPQVYQRGDSGLDSQTQEVIFNLDEGNLASARNTESNRGGILFKIVSVNDDGAETYDEWFEGQVSELVDDLGVL